MRRVGMGTRELSNSMAVSVVAATLDLNAPFLKVWGEGGEDWGKIYKFVSSGLLVGIFPGKWKPARNVVGGKVNTGVVFV